MSANPFETTPQAVTIRRDAINLADAPTAEVALFTPDNGALPFAFIRAAHKWQFALNDTIWIAGARFRVIHTADCAVLAVALPEVL